MPPEIDELTCLEFLRLDQNHLTTLSGEFTRLARLNTLYLNYNKFTSFPNSLPTQLCVLDLSGNRELTLLTPSLLALTSLEKLDLDGTAIDDDATAILGDLINGNRLLELHIRCMFTRFFVVSTLVSSLIVHAPQTVVH